MQLFTTMLLDPAPGAGSIAVDSDSHLVGNSEVAVSCLGERIITESLIEK
jgi:hypothetical protein